MYIAYVGEFLSNTCMYSRYLHRLSEQEDLDSGDRWRLLLGLWRYRITLKVEKYEQMYKYKRYVKTMFLFLLLRIFSPLSGIFFLILLLLLLLLSLLII